MRPGYALFATVILGTALVGCDATHAPEASSTVRLDAQSAPTGDVLYATPSLRDGESFDVALDVGVDQLTLRSTRTAAGYALEYVAGTQQPESVVISYFNNGVQVAEPVTVPGDGPVVAGTSEDGPDSWHYVWRDGAWILAKDYKNDDMTGDASTPFTLPSGEVVEVSDVTFELRGLDAPAPRSVEFEAPTPVAVTAQAFGRPLQ